MIRSSPRGTMQRHHPWRESGFDTLDGQVGGRIRFQAAGRMTGFAYGRPGCDDLITGRRPALIDLLDGEDWQRYALGGQGPLRIGSEGRGRGNDWIHAGSTLWLILMDGADGAGDWSMTPLLGGAGFDLLIGDAGDDQIDGGQAGRQPITAMRRPGHACWAGIWALIRLCSAGQGTTCFTGAMGRMVILAMPGNDTMWGGLRTRIASLAGVRR